MDNHLEEMLDNVDAAIFSGDGFFNKDALKRLKHYLGRWNRESERIEKFLNDWEDREQ